MLKLLWGASTEIGRVRDLNEDSVYAVPPLFAVADGMGGHAAGEVASALALHELSALSGREDLRPADILRSLDDANRAILEWSYANADAFGMGTTVSGVCLGTVAGTPHWFVFNVGDSRVYRFEGDRLSQITTDHSEAEELVSAGRLAPEQVRFYPRRNVVTRSLGTDPPPVPDLWVFPVGHVDTFLICSDGLTTEVDDRSILTLMRAGAGAQEVADALCQLAVANGGRDNVSVVIVRFDDEAGSSDVAVATAPRPRGTEA